MELTETVSEQKVIKKKKHRNSKKKTVLLYHLCLLPGVVLLIIFKFVPLIAGITMSFQDFKISKGLFGDQIWVGWENYRYIFSLPDIWRIIGNTVYISIWKMVLLIIIPIAVAVLLNEIKNVRYRNFLQTLMVIPHFISWILLAGVYKGFFSIDSGFLNNWLTSMGLDPLFIFGDPDSYVRFTIISDVLKEYGFSCIVYLAAISSIDQGQYEAAKIAGAGRLRQIFCITLPNIKHIILLMCLLSLGNVFNAGFDQIYNTYNSAVTSRGEILDTLIYTMGMSSREYSLSAALGLMKSTISVILMGVAYFIAWKKEKYLVF